MSEKYEVENKDIAGSQFRHVNMSGAVFDDVNLSGAKFFDVNLRGAEIGAVDFGGASFSCMNTGECYPKQPAVFKNLELDDCTIEKSYFRNTKLVNCDLTGMTIDGVLVTDMVKAYEKANSKS